MAAVWGDLIHGMDPEPHPQSTDSIVDIAPASNNSMTAVCSRPVLAPACLISAATHPSRPLFELTFQPGNRFTITRSARSTTIKVNTVHTAQPRDTPERPAGTLLTGTPTAFDPIVGAAAARSDLRRRRHRHDRRGDRHRGRLQQPGPGRWRLARNAKVIAGYNFATNTPDPMATTSQHGTAVAGPDRLRAIPITWASRLASTSSPCKVVGDNNTAALSNIAQALQWVIDNHSAVQHYRRQHVALRWRQLRSKLVCPGWRSRPADHRPDRPAQGLNIPVVSATGNSFHGQQGEGFTAIVARRDQRDGHRHRPINCFRTPSAWARRSGMGTMTDLAAPGEGLVAPSGDSG